jgi:spore maturation protein CgeB
VQPRDPNLIFVGGVGETNVATGYATAAATAGLSHQLIEYAGLFRWPLLWRVCRRIRRAPQEVWLVPSATARILQAGRPECRNVLLVCGLSQLPADVIGSAHAHGWHTGIYLTDSPWNRSLPYAVPLEQVTSYQRIFSPRRSDIAKLEELGVSHCTYLPFSYDPGQFYPEAVTDSECESDVLFVGGGDLARLPVIQAVLDLPIRTRIIGSYWPRLLGGHQAAVGQASHTVVRTATVRARINLCLVRRSNFDGHVMRSIEIGACGGCVLAERTDEHLDLLGPEGESATYFSDISEMRQKIAFLLDHPHRRVDLARRLRQRIETRFSYDTSLRTVLAAFGSSPP